MRILKKLLNQAANKAFKHFGTPDKDISFFTLEEQKALMQSIAKDHPRFLEYLEFLTEQDKEAYFVAITEKGRNITKGQFRRTARLYKLCLSDKPKLNIRRYAS